MLVPDHLLAVAIEPQQVHQLVLLVEHRHDQRLHQQGNLEDRLQHVQRLHQQDNLEDLLQHVNPLQHQPVNQATILVRQVHLIVEVVEVEEVSVAAVVAVVVECVAAAEEDSRINLYKKRAVSCAKQPFFYNRIPGGSNSL